MAPSSTSMPEPAASVIKATPPALMQEHKEPSNKPNPPLQQPQPSDVPPYISQQQPTTQPPPTTSSSNRSRSKSSKSRNTDRDRDRDARPDMMPQGYPPNMGNVPPFGYPGGFPGSQMGMPPGMGAFQPNPMMQQGPPGMMPPQMNPGQFPPGQFPPGPGQYPPM